MRSSLRLLPAAILEFYMRGKEEAGGGRGWRQTTEEQFFLAVKRRVVLQTSRLALGFSFPIALILSAAMAGAS